jgi:WD40 repeat protein/serine/threonine protein kinase/Flp pilus assembly protein TadD
VIARFEAERQALAMMDHPNIAKVLDGGATGEVAGGGWRVAGKEEDETFAPSTRYAPTGDVAGGGWRVAGKEEDEAFAPSTRHAPPATPSGRPYFVMELVNGVAITHFADGNRLAVCERLELFKDVCRAVQHAHQKGIIHRDLKPSNVMVTLHDETPVVKVIDFGIAKATSHQLTDKTLFTNVAQMMGTPLYMSPEQAQTSGLDVDTRTDIYSLGVLLYELLTGTTPFDNERFGTAPCDEMRRIIREEEPAPPSTRLRKDEGGRMKDETKPSTRTRWRRFLPFSSFILHPSSFQELDWITMKCLEKDRNRRYQTANSLAGDIERYLHDEPVLACPPSAWYRFSKFTRRYKGTLTAVTLVLVTLVVGSVISIGQAIRATRAQGLADLRLAGEMAARRDADNALAAETRAKDHLSRTLKSEQQSLYFRRIARADLEWWNNNVGRADQILDECPAEYRHWEWRCLKRLCHSDLVTLAGHTQPVHAVAFSPDGQRLASASVDQSVRIWDLATGKEIRTLAGHSRMVNCVAWSADGRWLASGSGVWDEARPGEVKVWDAAKGQVVFNLTGQKGAVAGVAFSPDGQRLAAANWDSTVRLWDLTTGQQVRVLAGHQVRCIAFSPDGQRLAAGCHERTVIIWDAASFEQQCTLRGHTGDVYSVAFSPDGRRLVSGSWDGSVQVWDLASAKELSGFSPPRHTDIARGVDFSPDGQRIASASNDGFVKIWNAETGQEVATLRGHSGYVCGVAFSPGGRCLASASWDHTVKVWDLTSGQQGRSFNAAARLFRSALSPDGQRIAMASRTPDSPQRLIPLKVYDVTTGRQTLLLGQCGGGFHGAAFSPDGRRIASDWNKDVKIWDARTGHELFTLRGHTAPVASVAFSPDSQRLASASEDKTVKLWDAKAGKEFLTLVGHTQPLTCVAFSPDGQRLASASKDGTVKVWDANSARELLTLRGHDASVTDVAFSRQGDRLVSASEDRTVRIWDSQTWQAIRTLPGHTGAVTAVGFSPDGQRMVSASLDGSVRLWDAATGEEALTLRRQFNEVYGVSFTPDGGRLVASGNIFAAYAGFKVWETKQSGDRQQEAREEVLKADAPQNACFCFLRGQAHSQSLRWDRAVADYSKAIDLGRQDWSVFDARGNAYAMLRRYQSAAADYALAVKKNPSDPHLWFCHAVARVGADDLIGSRAVCAGMRERFAKSKDPVAAGRVVWACLVAEDPGISTALMVQLAKLASSDRLYFRVLGHALYRDGQYEAAVRHFERLAITVSPWLDDQLFLAMAQKRLGQDKTARATFAKAETAIASLEQTVARGGYWCWFDQVLVRRLRTEAKSLLEGK